MRSLLAGLLLLGLSWGAYYCGDTGLFFDNKNFCDANCSNPCDTLQDNPQGLACDTTNYELFIYNPQTNKTIAITKAAGFWEDFSSAVLLRIDDVTDNVAGQTILSYLNESGWIGLYDPNRSASFNSVDPSRFVWVDGTARSYSNWGNGEPNNSVPTEDIGAVSPLGEHWVYMGTDGKWYDDGLHLSYGGDYKPRYRALVQFDGQLDCVNGLVQNDQTTNQDLVNLFCNGQTPCYLCTNGVDNVDRCSQGQVSGQNVSGWLCPISKVSCNVDPVCPQGSTYNASTGKCEADVTIVCPSGGGYNAQTKRCEASPI